MKFSFLFIFIMYFLCIDVQAQNGEVRYDLSKDHSSVKWSTPVGEKQEYNGSFKIKEGYAVMMEGKLTQLVVFIHTQSFEISNMPDEKDRQDLTSYVHSEAFLNTVNMDFAVFKAYKISELKDSKEGNYTLEGALVMKAYNNTIHFPASAEVKKDKFIASAKITLNRLLWKLDSPLRADGTAYPVQNTVTLYISLEGSKVK